jgi:branched-chain amino acid aminotransferase
MTDSICYINGEFVPLTKAALPVQDLAILRGYGVFDFLRTYDGKPFRLRPHLERLAQSACLIDLDLPGSLSELEAIVLETYQRNVLPEANIRIVVTGGLSADSLNPVSKPTLMVLVTPAHQYPSSCYQAGVKVITVEVERYIPRAKTINYIPALMALKKARAVGAIEALYVNRQGQILEGTTTNFFVFQKDQLITPVDGILPGITRNVVLELAQSHFEVIERPILLSQVVEFDEAFITASNKEIMPVCQINQHTIGNGVPGPQTEGLMEMFQRATRGEFRGQPAPG